MFILKTLILAAFLSFFNFEPTQEKISIYSIGDSTMAYYSPENLLKNYGSIDYPLRGWMMSMSKYFNDSVTIRNFAISGRSSKSFRDQGHWDRVMKLIQPGDYVFIQFGHNDSKKEDTSRYTDPHTTFRQNIFNYIEETKQKGGRPVLFTSIARREFDSTGHLIDSHGDYVSVVRELAEETNTPLVDLNKKTTIMITEMGPEESKKIFLYIDANIFPKIPDGLKDDTHLNEAGATKVAALAAEGIKELNLPLAEYLKR